MAVTTATEKPRSASVIGKHIKHILCLLLFVITDGVTLIFSLLLATVLREELLPRLLQFVPSESFPLSHYLEFWWLPLVWFGFFTSEGLYTKRQTLWDEVQSLWKATTLATITVFAIIALGHLSPWFSRPTIVFTWLITLALFPLSRLAIKKVLFHIGLWRQDVLILGAAETGRLTLKALNREPLLGYQVIGFLDDHSSKQGKCIGHSNGHAVNVIGVLSEAKAYLKEGIAQDVIVAMPGISEEKLIPMVRDLKDNANRIRVIPNVWALPAMSPEIDHFMYNQVFMVSLPSNLLRPWSQLLKRGFDIAISTIALILLSPIFGLIAAAIKLESPGPILFKWHVVGRNGIPFVSYKFRSMYENADEIKEQYLEQNEMTGPVFKMRNDPRITRGGSVLRKFSLDELPQLVSVLKGDMSLVGPRPPLVYEYEQFTEWQKRKMAVKPGMISLWHISGKPSDFDEWVRLDLEYIDRWTLWLDVKILLLGALYLVFGQGETVTSSDENP